MAQAGPPMLFHVGYHKTATTWLQHDHFPEHPSQHLGIDLARWGYVIEES